MDPQPASSEFRFEKRRADALLWLVTGESVKGCFFTSAGSTRRHGAERISDLLNSQTGFFPFEVHEESDSDGRTVQYNRVHVVAVEVFDDEARRDTGYEVATRRLVSILLANGRRIEGAVRVYRPEGRNRVSDWTHEAEAFRYVEGPDITLIVNALHIVSVTEVLGS
jgi:hypothetical protein